MDEVLHHTTYFKTLDRMVKKIKKYLADNGITDCALAVRGLSGLLAGPYVAAKLKIDFCAIRKYDESAHSGNRIEGVKFVRNYIIVDDFVESGATVREIHEEMSNEYDNPKLLAVFCYSSMSGYQERTIDIWDETAEENKEAKVYYTRD